MNSAMVEPEPEAAVVAGARDVLALRWTGVSVKVARKRDVLRWCRVHCSPAFLEAQNLAGAGSVDGIVKSRSAWVARTNRGAASLPQSMPTPPWARPTPCRILGRWLAKRIQNFSPSGLPSHGQKGDQVTARKVEQ